MFKDLAGEGEALSSGLTLTVFCRKNWKSQKVSWSCSTISWKSITISWKPCWYSGGRGQLGGAEEEGRAWAWAGKESQQGIEKRGPRGRLRLRHTCLGVADIAQEQDLLQLLLVNKDVAQGIFVVEFLDVIC